MIHLRQEAVMGFHLVNQLSASLTQAKKNITTKFSLIMEDRNQETQETSSCTKGCIMVTKEQLEKRVQKGIKFLNKKYPNWHKKIKLKHLDMQNGKCCILGQLYNHFTHGIDELKLKEGMPLGFSLSCDDADDAWASLTTLWKTAIQQKLPAVLKEA